MFSLTTTRTWALVPTLILLVGGIKAFYPYDGANMLVVASLSQANPIT